MVFSLNHLVPVMEGLRSVERLNLGMTETPDDDGPLGRNSLSACEGLGS